MPLEIIRNDITKVHVDAIVNAAHTSLLGEGGADGAIHQAAGPQLREECKRLGGCETGKVKMTRGYDLPAKYVIHTVGPVWHGGYNNEEKLLADCYNNSLRLAKDHNLKSIAFPLISSGLLGYPKDKALKTAISVIGDFLLINDMMVFLVVYDKTAFVLSQKLFSSIRQYIDDRYIYELKVNTRGSFSDISLRSEYPKEESKLSSEIRSMKKSKRSLEDVVNHLDESFSQKLFRLIDEKGMTDTETYKKANIDRKLFSKIRNDINYSPSKPTVLAFAIALSLNLDETRDLLLRAGFALSHSSKFDIIIEYFIEEKNYNIFELNEVLFAFDQNLLGA